MLAVNEVTPGDKLRRDNMKRLSSDQNNDRTIAKKNKFHKDVERAAAGWISADKINRGALPDSAPDTGPQCYKKLSLEKLSVPKTHVTSQSGDEKRGTSTMVKNILRGMIRRSKFDAEREINSFSGKLLIFNGSTRTGPKPVASEIERVNKREILSSKKLKKLNIRPMKSGKSEDIKFKNFLDLHEFWKQYIMEVLKSASRKQNQLQETFLKADFQGAYMEVEKSRVYSLIGILGIVVEETNDLFIIIGMDNKIRRVPKIDSIFAFSAGKLKVTVCGSELVGRHNFANCLKDPKDSKPKKFTTTAL